MNIYGSVRIWTGVSNSRSWKDTRLPHRPCDRGKAAALIIFQSAWRHPYGSIKSYGFTVYHGILYDVYSKGGKFLRLPEP